MNFENVIDMMLSLMTDYNIVDVSDEQLMLELNKFISVIEMFKSVNKDNVLEYEDKINKLFRNVDNGFLNTKTIYKVKKDGKKA